MTTDDVSDLREVVDAINKLCETMKTSYDYDDADDQPETDDASVETETKPKTPETDDASVTEPKTETIPVEAETPRAVKTEDSETWSGPLAADVAAEMYYSAIAEASLDMWNDSIGVTQDPRDVFYNATSEIVPRTKRSSIESGLGSEVEHPPRVFEEQCGLGPAEIEVVDEIETCYPKEAPESETGHPKFAPATGHQKVATEIDQGHREYSSQVKTSLTSPVEIERPKGSSDETETSSVKKSEKYETETAYETSEMYYTASSEVSLLSDIDLERNDDEKEKGDRNIMAGHVAAMRERFESMTRANTPCPDLGRSLSPSLDMYRNITPSPDFLDRS